MPPLAPLSRPAPGSARSCKQLIAQAPLFFHILQQIRML
ncbi:hypothetical protein B8V81_3048 [Paenibacillus pasadenensis]|uniref:Uncharacterized protein n=1 Tax=Paenibacillus pasadenensis TaxID=217090 RepID=A0A2N5N2P1_9BACL|nr:hypothetical protein B8V81_3048 [Paenibacillus pasadenensis]